LALPGTAFDNQTDVIFTNGFESGHTPVIVSTPPTTAEIGVLYTYDVDATDLDGDTLVYQLNAAPEGMTIHPASGLVEWMPSANGEFPVAVTVSDGNGGVAQQQWTIAVGAGAIATVTVDPAWVFFSAQGQTFQLTAQVLDADLNPIAGEVTWHSTAPDRVSVSQTGKLLAEAVGSAQIYAEAGGIQSSATLVAVAIPVNGAMLVYDDQVVQIGEPLPTLPDEPDWYEVTLRNVSAPPIGTIVLAAETAPIAGRLLDYRAVAEGIMFTLEIVSLNQLFEDYYIDWSIDISDYALEEAPPSPAEAWSLQKANSVNSLMPRAAAAEKKFLNILECEDSVKSDLINPSASISVEYPLRLNVMDVPPNGSIHTVEGGLEINGSVSLTLGPNFEASGSCEAKGEINLPIFGWASVLVIPIVQVGGGADLSGSVKVEPGEIGATGKFGFSTAFGWACGGEEPGCRGMSTPPALVNNLESKSKFSSKEGARVNVSGHLYGLIRLDLKIFAGLLYQGNILKAKFGPKQSFDLAFERDQSDDPDYASTYDLTLEGGIYPGESILKALERLTNGASEIIDFGIPLKMDLSTSPKGVAQVSANHAYIGKPIDMTVQIDPSTKEYKLIGYNIDSIEIYRRRWNEMYFAYFDTIPVTASVQDIFQYSWTPTGEDAGDQEFAFFVNTKLPTPFLEISEDSVKKVNVSCFAVDDSLMINESNGRVEGIPTIRAATSSNNISASLSTCADTWVGWASSIDSIHIADVDVVWIRDSEPLPGLARYRPEGVAKVKFPYYEAQGCSVSPNTFSITANDSNVSYLMVDYRESPIVYAGHGWVMDQNMAAYTATLYCPPPDEPTEIYVLFEWFAAPDGFVSSDGVILEDQYDSPYSDQSWGWHFVRP
jgi:hypothetical protein